jgi:hypothetical protein
VTDFSSIPLVGLSRDEFRYGTLSYFVTPSLYIFSVHFFPFNLPLDAKYFELPTASLMVSVYEATRCHFPEKSSIHIHCGIKLRIHRINPIRKGKERGCSRDTAVRVHALKVNGGVGVYLRSFVTSTLTGHECSASRPGQFTWGRSHPLHTE